MISWKMIERSYKAILRKVGDPPIRLVQSGDFYRTTGARLGDFSGRCSIPLRIITVNRNRSLGHIKNTLWHEIAHVLFPSRPHWWIECFASKMSGSGECGSWIKVEDGIQTSGAACGRYSARYCKSKDDLPSRPRLLELARKSSARTKGE